DEAARRVDGDPRIALIAGGVRVHQELGTERRSGSVEPARRDRVARPVEVALPCGNETTRRYHRHARERLYHGRVGAQLELASGGSAVAGIPPRPHGHERVRRRAGPCDDELPRRPGSNGGAELVSRRVLVHLELAADPVTGRIEALRKNAAFRAILEIA